jgi:hypothetical protein
VKKYKRSILHIFLYTLYLIYIYYKIDLIDTLLYSVVFYMSLILRELFYKLRIVHALVTLCFIYIYYETDLIDTLLYSVVSYPSPLILR